MRGTTGRVEGLSNRLYAKSIKLIRIIWLISWFTRARSELDANPASFLKRSRKLCPRMEYSREFFRIYPNLSLKADFRGFCSSKLYSLKTRKRPKIDEFIYRSEIPPSSRRSIAESGDRGFPIFREVFDRRAAVI